MFQYSPNYTLQDSPKYAHTKGQNLVLLTEIPLHQLKPMSCAVIEIRPQKPLHNAKG